MERAGRFFLIWTYGWEYAHDQDEWVAVCSSTGELRREYLRAYAEREKWWCVSVKLDYLQGYEYLGEGRFRELPAEEFLEEGDPRTPVITGDMRREYYRRERAEKP